MEIRETMLYTFNGVKVNQWKLSGLVYSGIKYILETNLRRHGLYLMYLRENSCKSIDFDIYVDVDTMVISNPTTSVVMDVVGADMTLCCSVAEQLIRATVVSYVGSKLEEASNLEDVVVSHIANNIGNKHIASIVSNYIKTMYFDASYTFNITTMDSTIPIKLGRTAKSFVEVLSDRLVPLAILHSVKNGTF